MKKEFQQMMGLFLLAITSLTLLAAEAASSLPPTEVPGVVISHFPGPSGPYVGSPSIVILPNGSYVASHDLFGAKSTQNTSGRTLVFGSQDKGLSWKKLAEFQEAFWSSLFVHGGELYMIGTSKEYGDVVIRRSVDGGTTWTEPNDAVSGRLSEDAQYHCAPMPVIVHNGRLWRAIEQCNPNKGWGLKFRAGMLSAPVGSDLLRRDSWTFSNFLASDTTWVNGTFGGWLEGNAVVTPEGEMVDILRVSTTGYPEQGAVVRISKDGRLAWFDPLSGFIHMPGGAKKFTIRFDPQSGLYWTLANLVPEQHRKGNPGGVRNTLTLLCSKDLRSWTARCHLLYHPDVAKHGFQYVDWQFEDDDLIAASRTAYDDHAGNARSAHDANYLTFHRFAHFRELTMDDSVPFYKIPQVTAESSELEITGQRWVIAELEEQGLAYANREYIWFQLPDELRTGWQYTRMSGGESAELEVKAKQDTRVRIFTTVNQKKMDAAGWKKVEGWQFRYNDGSKTLMQVYEQSLKQGERLDIPQGNWTGGMLLIKK